MPAKSLSFTLDELKSMLALEIAKANASIVQSQVDAWVAMSSDSLLARDMMQPTWLQLNSIQIRFSLAQVESSWLNDVWQSLVAWWSGRSNPRSKVFRFASQRDGIRSLQFVCNLTQKAGAPQLDGDIVKDVNAAEV